MGILEILLVCLGISFDVIAVAVCYGAVLLEIKADRLIRLTAIFCVFQVAAATAGNLIALIPLYRERTENAATICNACSIIILVGLGLFLLYKGWKNSDILERRSDIDFRRVWFTAALASIDSFFAGLSFAMWDASVLAVIICLFVITALAVISGIYVGYHLGYEPRRNVYRIGAGVLIVAAIDVLIRLLVA